jgi:hypothetical protein
LNSGLDLIQSLVYLFEGLGVLIEGLVDFADVFEQLCDLLLWLLDILGGLGLVHCSGLRLVHDR